MSDVEQPQFISRKELEAKIIAKAWTDEDFRQKFLADPKGQFEEHLGTRLPDGLVMTAHQEDADHLYFVIPAKPPVDLDELSDEDLEKVAGGIDIVVLGGIGMGATFVIGGLVGGVLTLLVAVGGIGVTASVAGGVAVNWGRK